MGLKSIHILSFALAVFLLALSAIPHDREYGILLNRSFLPNEAEPYLREAHRLRPEDRLVVRELANLHLHRQHPAEGARLLERWLVTHPQDDEIRQQAVGLYLQENHLAAAIRLLEQAPRRSGAINERLLALYTQSGRLDAAAEMLRGGLDGTPADLGRWNQIADLAGWRANLPLLAEALEATNRLQPNPENTLRLLQLYAWQGKVAEAARVGDQLETFAEPGTEALRTLVAVRIRARDLPGAIRAADRLAVTEDSSPQDHIDLVQLLLWAKREPDAFTAAEAGLRTFPDALVLLDFAAEIGVRLRAAEAPRWVVRLAEQKQSDLGWQRGTEMLLELERPVAGLEALAPIVARPDAPAGAILAAARLAFAASDPARAGAFVDRLLTLKEHPTGRLLQLSALLLDLKRDDEAKTLLALALANLPRETEERLALVEALARTRQSQVGLEILRATERERFPDRYDALLLTLLLDRLAEVAPSAQPPLRAEAIALLEPRRATLGLEELVALAGLYLAEDRREDAARLIPAGEIPAILASPLANAFITAGEKERAREILARLGPTNTLSAGELSDLGWHFERLEEHERAILFYAEADRLSGGEDSIRLALADAHGGAGDRARQYAILDARAQALGSEQAWLDALDRRLWNQDPASEAAAAERALETLPESEEILARALGAYAALNRPEQVITLHQRLEALATRPGATPRSASTEAVIARAYLTLKNLPAARAALHRSLAARKDLPAEGEMELEREWIYLAIALDEDRLATRLLRGVLARAPNDAEALYLLGERLAALGKNPREIWRRALAADPRPQDGEGWMRRANLLFLVGPRPASFAAAERALALGLKEPWLALEYAEAIIGQRWDSQAARLLTALADRFPKEKRIPRLQARLALEQRDFARARAILEPLVAAAPRESELHADLANVEDRAGNPHRARTLYERAIALRTGGGR